MAAPTLVPRTSIRHALAAWQLVQAGPTTLAQAGHRVMVEPQTASDAVMVAADLDAFPEINLTYLSHPVVRKEGA